MTRREAIAAASKYGFAAVVTQLIDKFGFEPEEALSALDIL